MNYLWIFLGLGSGNFLYQHLISTTPNMESAFERTYFQGIAIFCCWLLSKYGG